MFEEQKEYEKIRNNNKKLLEININNGVCRLFSLTVSILKKNNISLPFTVK